MAARLSRNHRGIWAPGPFTGPPETAQETDPRRSLAAWEALELSTSQGHECGFLITR